MKFFTIRGRRDARPEPAARAVPAPRPVPVRRMPAGTPGARPALAAATDTDLTALYGLGTVRSVATGAPLVLDAGLHYVVVDGTLELRVAALGPAIEVGAIERGACLATAAAAGALACAAGAAGATVIELSAPAFELLPPALQRTLDRSAVTTTARSLNALAARHAAAEGRTAALVAAVRDAGARAARMLAASPLREALAAIPALPIHATDLAMRLLDDMTRADDLAEAIKSDPALAGLVLKRVNSAAYGLEVKVTDHYHALLLLGTAMVSQLVLESAVDDVIPPTPDARAIQARATATSILAYEIALASGKIAPLAASTIGLLHNIGDSLTLLLRRDRPALAGVLEGVPGPAVGGAVLASWGLPARVCEVVRRQDEAPMLGAEGLGEYADELAVLSLARVAHDAVLDGVTPPAFVAEHMMRLGLRDTDGAAFCREVLAPALTRRGNALPAAIRARLRS